MNINESRDYFYHLHDIECNQKYNKILPYSFHLDMVEKQAIKFIHLIPNEKLFPLNSFNSDTIKTLVIIGCQGHDSIEDARITYNDLVEKFEESVAEIIYLCSENKGRNRTQRKNDNFYIELKQNKYAVFVKLCDIIANVKFGLLSNSTMFDKARKEYPKIKEHLSIWAEYKPMFDYLEKIFELN